MKYYDKKSIKSFVYQILSAENGLFAVKSKFGEKYTFSENDDLLDEVDAEQIIQVLDEPLFDSNRHYTFNFSYLKD